MVSIWYTRRSDTQGYVPHVKLILKSSVFQPRSSTPLHPRPVFSATYKMLFLPTPFVSNSCEKHPGWGGKNETQAKAKRQDPPNSPRESQNGTRILYS